MTTNITFNLSLKNSYIINNNNMIFNDNNDLMNSFTNDFENLSFSIKNITLNNSFSFIIFNIINDLNNNEYEIKSLVDYSLLQTLINKQNYIDYYFEKNIDNKNNNDLLNLIFDVSFNY